MSWLTQRFAICLATCHSSFKPHGSSPSSLTPPNMCLLPEFPCWLSLALLLLQLSSPRYAITFFYYGSTVLLIVCKMSLFWLTLQQVSPIDPLSAFSAVDLPLGDLAISAVSSSCLQALSTYTVIRRVPSNHLTSQAFAFQSNILACLSNIVAIRHGLWADHWIAKFSLTLQAVSEVARHRDWSDCILKSKSAILSYKRTTTTLLMNLWLEGWSLQWLLLGCSFSG